MIGIPPDQVAILTCPRCAGPLERMERWLQCSRCRAPYEVRAGIPDLLPWSGGAPGPEWDLWREKLGLLQRWRRETWDGTAASQSRQEVADTMAERFFAFARIRGPARVLEIGCGHAQLARHLPGCAYWGIDPLVEPPTSPPGGAAGDRPMLVRGVGERLPLASGSFDAAFLCETLDHALDPARVVSEAKRVLRDDGILAIMQSAVTEDRAPLKTRLRAAGGRLKARLAGRRPPLSDARTKMHILKPDQIPSLVRTHLEVDELAAYGQAVLVRAVKRQRPGRPPDQQDRGRA